MLEDWIEERIADLDIAKANTISVLGTKKRYTRLMNFPQSASLGDLLRMAHRLNVHPLFLHKKFEFAARDLGKDDIEILGLHYTITPMQESQTPPLHVHPSQPGNQPAADPGIPARRATSQSPIGAGILP